MFDLHQCTAPIHNTINPSRPSSAQQSRPMPREEQPGPSQGDQLKMNRINHSMPPSRCFRPELGYSRTAVPVLSATALGRCAASTAATCWSRRGARLHIPCRLVPSQAASNGDIPKTPIPIFESQCPIDVLQFPVLIVMAVQLEAFQQMYFLIDFMLPK